MKISRIEERLRIISFKHFPYSNVIGVSRSILALGTLLTLLFNSSAVLVQRNIEGIPFNPMLDPTEKLNQFNFFLLFGVEYFDLMKLVAILILLLVISGFYIGISSILHWWISISFFFCSSVIDGGDQIAAVLSFFLIPLCLTDTRKNHWVTIKPFISSKNLVGIFSVFLIRLQVAFIYLHAAVGKFEVEEWMNGTALYYWLNHSFFGSSDYLIPWINTILKHDWLVTMSTYGVLVFELALFLALTASKRYRKTLLPLAIAFHFLIIIFHGIFSFFFSIVAGLIIYLHSVNEPFQLKRYALLKN